ncbi:MAG: nucleotidyltransferase family protein [Candidatus Omnitrophica bacterium]|nr:nucleotidyltransferase family protein [Candidatus Omnitrophota bacterium]MDD5042741.1 nucleotidyltransferase family protein [Candidatus Omnitrophota bacterium]MDD5500484.1 nucleotidyltransferase family protein [Candidatus Omnitrophota bacterium]
MKVLILAAGYATRLYPLTREYPKPLLEVKSKPIINHIIGKLEKIPAVDEIYVVTNSKFIRVFRGWARSLKSSKKITLVDDLTKSNQDRLGAIGDIDFVIARKRIKDDLLVIGGDNLFSGSLNKFLSYSGKRPSKASIGLYRLKRREDARRYGVVELDASGKVAGFEEKPDKPKSSLVAMCLYFIPACLLKMVREYISSKKGKTDTTGGYIAWLGRRSDIYGHIFKGSWFDIGDHKYLNAAKKKFV